MHRLALHRRPIQLTGPRSKSWSKQVQNQRANPILLVIAVVGRLSRHVTCPRVLSCEMESIINKIER